MMTRNVRTITGLLALAILAGGCEAQKSENPLSPNVAGPIAGVSISVPAPVSPSAGSEVLNSSPVRLTFANSSTNGVRPLWYVVELASDSSFNSKIYTNGRVLPAEGAQTIVTVETNLPTEATYFWRVKADDGANASEFSAAAHFDLVVPVSIAAPTPASPSGGQTTSTRTPTLSVNNGSVTGRAGHVEYKFEVATDQAFASVVMTLAAARSSSGTTSVQTNELAANTLFFWRAWGTNGQHHGPLSGTQSFRTPAAPAPGPGPGPGPGVPPPPAGGHRTPDPAPGQRLPLPNMSGVVAQVAAQYPGALSNSCQEHGGTWEFMDRVVNELRKYDTRWGYNWKRGNVGDPSMDVVDYHYGSGPDEGSTNVYIIDIIVGHCGAGPQPGWGDMTEVTRQQGTIGRWTSRGRF